MMKNGKPQDVGLEEKYLRRFISRMEKNNINLHSVLMARGNTIFFEKYAPPFDADTPHRMYSITKSFVALAAGALIREGKLSLDDRFADFYPDRCPPDMDPLLKTQTIRDMLMMRTCFAGNAASCGPDAMQDRIGFYLRQKANKFPGTLFDYDSAGSHVLGALIEDLTGMDLLSYLRLRILNQLGGFENAVMLRTPDGHAWGSSALICTPSALLNVVYFLLCGGVWEGQRLLDESFVRDAISNLTNNNLDDGDRFNDHGYGYLIWQNLRGSFSFSGMCGQIGLGLPSKNLSFVCTANTCLHTNDDKPRIIDALFEEVVDHLDGQENVEPDVDLSALLPTHISRGSTDSLFANRINGRCFVCRSNPMGSRSFSLSWEHGRGLFRYVNEQGEKELPFGMKENIYSPFPQLGYSDEIGFQHIITDFRYRCAASGGWIEEKTLQLRIEILDKYFGMLVITFGFLDDRHVSVRMVKDAQDFLDEYNGWMMAECTCQEKVDREKE